MSGQIHPSLGCYPVVPSDPERLDRGLPQPHHITHETRVTTSDPYPLPSSYPWVTGRRTFKDVVGSRVEVRPRSTPTPTPFTMGKRFPTRRKPQVPWRRQTSTPPSQKWVEGARGKKRCGTEHRPRMSGSVPSDTGRREPGSCENLKTFLHNKT